MVFVRWSMARWSFTLAGTTVPPLRGTMEECLCVAGQVSASIPVTTCHNLNNLHKSRQGKSLMSAVQIHQRAGNGRQGKQTECWALLAPFPYSCNRPGFNQADQARVPSCLVGGLSTLAMKRYAESIERLPSRSTPCSSATNLLSLQACPSYELQYFSGVTSFQCPPKLAGSPSGECLYLLPIKPNTSLVHIVS